VEHSGASNTFTARSERYNQTRFKLISKKNPWNADPVMLPIPGTSSVAHMEEMLLPWS
jgi:hypothetical protein